MEPFCYHFGLEKNARAIAFGISKNKVIKIKLSGKTETQWKIGYRMMNEMTSLAL